MKKYAVLDDNNIVENIIVATSLELAELATSKYCIALTPDTNSVQIGDLYSNGNFTKVEN